MKYKILRNAEVSELSFKEILNNQKTLLFFYPRDNTPGCTKENVDFTNLKQEFSDLGIQLIWVSKDSIESHQKFVEKQSLTNDLISDPNLVLHKEFWAFWEKNNYWKIVLWVIRSTFLLDGKGEIIDSWKNIRATGHAERILKLLK